MKLKKIYNRLFPLKGFKALTIVPYIFVREEQRDTFGEAAERHETTHALQQIECLIIGALLAVAMFFFGCGWWSLIPLGLFFELYLLEWAIKTLCCRFDTKRAYMSISTEQEAYATMYDVEYNANRKHYAWVKYIFTLTPKID